MDKNGFKITSTKKVVPRRTYYPMKVDIIRRSVTRSSKGLIAQLLQTVYTYCIVPTGIGLFFKILQINQSDFIITALLIGDLIVETRNSINPINKF